MSDRALRASERSTHHTGIYLLQVSRFRLASAVIVLGDRCQYRTRNSTADNTVHISTCTTVHGAQDCTTGANKLDEDVEAEYTADATCGACGVVSLDSTGCWRRRRARELLERNIGAVGSTDYASVTPGHKWKCRGGLRQLPPESPEAPSAHRSACHLAAFVRLY